jgi:hypothetical protein
MPIMIRALRDMCDAEAEQEFDQALKFADKAFRHFFNIMEQAKKKPKKDAI